MDWAWKITFMGASIKGCRAIGFCSDCCRITLLQIKSVGSTPGCEMAKHCVQKAFIFEYVI
jgi:hypothetical protein